MNDNGNSRLKDTPTIVPMLQRGNATGDAPASDRDDVMRMLAR